MSPLKNKTILITGSTRGIGRAIALKCAADNANIVITGKSKKPHPKLKGTLDSVAKEVEAIGGKALPLKLDVRDEDNIAIVVAEAVKCFGGIDILVNNASAISLTNTLGTSLKKFDLMMSVNARATFACSRACIPHLCKAANPHILNIAPPLNMNAKWFKEHLAYTYSKYGMSICTLGMAAEFSKEGIAVNSLWPKTTIATDAVKVHFPPEILAGSREPNIVADAAYSIITKNSHEITGNFFIDEDVLKKEGISDFSVYQKNSCIDTFPDLFLE